jgi:hypothetical protein
MFFRSSLAVSAAALALALTLLAQQKPDYGKLKPVLSGNIPRLVPEFPFSSFPIDTRPMFDYFAWENFIAVMWPSRPEDRGEPYKPNDPAVMNAGYVNGLQPAFLGWKTAYDLYPQNGSKPTAWDAPSADNPCRGATQGDKRPMLTSFSKFGNVADELDQAFAGPLIDQTGLLTRYEVRFNRVEYDYVRNNGFYNVTPNQPPVNFPASSADRLGAIEVKIAWRDLSKVDPKFRSRFYNVEAWAVQPGTCKTNPGGRPVDCACTLIPAGLVGFHIAHKTEKFPQWVWTTFEQVDNLGEDPSMPAGMKPSFYNGTRANPADHPGYSYMPPSVNPAPGTKPAPMPTIPVNAVRLSAIPSTPAALPTTALNTQFRKLLTSTVWQNYWLIGTQWSSLPAFPPQSPLQPPWAKTNQMDFGCEDGTPATVGGQAFPACQVSNITMETYHQLDSCQNCHQGAQRFGTDFSWSMQQRAYKAPAPSTARK